MPALQIGYHDHCFDGVASAATFLRFYREKVKRVSDVAFKGLAHRAGQLFGPDVFAGTENAVVDFRFSADPRLTWWFDHHQSAFLTPADAEHFRRDTSGRKFYGPEFRSCTKFLAHVGSTKFGFAASDLEELIHWADVIDGAQYPDIQSAVEMRDPATQLTLVIEGTRSKGFVAGLIPELLSKPLHQIAALPHIRQAFELADRQTVRDRLHITTLYYDLGTGDIRKAIQSYQQWVELYPRDDIAKGNLASEYFLVGDYEQAANFASQALRLDAAVSDHLVDYVAYRLRKRLVVFLDCDVIVRVFAGQIGASFTGVTLTETVAVFPKT